MQCECDQSTRERFGRRAAGARRGAALQDARRELLELLCNLGGRSVELVGDAALLVGRETEVLRDEVAVDDALDGEVRRAEE